MESGPSLSDRLRRALAWCLDHDVKTIDLICEAGKIDELARKSKLDPDVTRRWMSHLAKQRAVAGQLGAGGPPLGIIGVPGGPIADLRRRGGLCQAKRPP